MRHDSLAIIVFFSALIIFLCPVIAGTTELATIRVISGLSSPTFITSFPQEPRSLLITEQSAGTIRIVRNGQLMRRPFLDIHDRISSGGERGLLSVVFHPDYTSNGFFFVDYTDLSGNTKISRFQVTSDPDSADPASEYNILSINQPYANHNGGMLAFGPNDGFLYIGMGDGGSGGDPQNRAQSDSVLLGKILRIDVDGGTPYAIPPTNPFIDMPGKRPEIWAKGVRNPWRFTFDPFNGDLYIADVGQNLWEEVDFQPASAPGGENYGWRLMEGSHCYNPPVDCDPGGLVYPIYEYSHDFGCSISGGYVYRGGVMPRLSGTYFFGDFCSARIWSFFYDGHNVNDLTERTNELAPGGGFSIGSISTFGVDGIGEMYIADYSDGEIYKIVPRNPGMVRGRVTMESGEVIPDAAVSIPRAGLADTTDGDGLFALGGLGDGAFDIHFSAPGERDTVLSGVIIMPGETTEVNLVFPDSTSGTTSDPVPNRFKLFQNYPNPFNSTTKIEYELGHDCLVRIDVFDIRGRRVSTLIDDTQQSGYHRVIWDADGASTGLYTYRIKAGLFTRVKKMVLLK